MLYLSLSLLHTHTHARTHARMHARTHISVPSPIQSREYKYLQKPWCWSGGKFPGPEWTATRTVLRWDWLCPSLAVLWWSALSLFLSVPPPPSPCRSSSSSSSSFSSSLFDWHLTDLCAYAALLVYSSELKQKEDGAMECKHSGNWSKSKAMPGKRIQFAVSDVLWAFSVSFWELKYRPHGRCQTDLIYTVYRHWFKNSIVFIYLYQKSCKDKRFHVSALLIFREEDIACLFQWSQNSEQSNWFLQPNLNKTRR